jgi:transglutaminase-like putative cysteine protease
MARAAGHPTRVIIGLAGAEFSQKERRYVAKLPLHAWNEIFDGTKWVRVEPTPGKGDGKPQELQKPKVEEPERSVDWKPKLKPRNLKLVTEFERAQWPESYRKAIEAYFTTIGNLQR